MEARIVGPALERIVGPALDLRASQAGPMAPVHNFMQYSDISLNPI